MTRSSLVDVTVQPVRNIVQAPWPRFSGLATPGISNTRWFGGGGAAGTYTIVNSATPWGPRYARKVWTVVATGNGDSGFDVSPAPGGAKVVPGQRITAVGFLRPSVADKVGAINIYWRDSTGTTLSRSNAASVALAGNTWTMLTNTAVAPALSASFIFAVDINAGGAFWQVGDMLDIAAAAAYYGDYPYYIDGFGPNSTWTGATGQSDSVGYPPGRNLMMDSDFFTLVDRTSLPQVSADSYVGNYGGGTHRMINDPTDGRILEITSHDPSGTAGPTDQIGGIIIRPRRLFNSGSGDWSTLLPLKQGQTFTISAELRSDTPVIDGANLGARIEGELYNYGTEGSVSVNLTTTWTRWTRTLSVPSGASVGKYPAIQTYGKGNGGDGYTYYLRRPQIEMGSVLTPYVPGPPDDAAYGGIHSSLYSGFSYDGGAPDTTEFVDQALDGGGP